MNEFHHFLRTRRSVRRFKPAPVPASIVDRILATTIFAPSAHNLQPWRFALIQSGSAKEKLGNALTSKMRADSEAKGENQAEIEKRVNNSLRRIAEAPVIILLCRDVSAIRTEEPEETTMSIQSVATAGLQLLLAAHAEGLGGNWICWPLYAQEAVQDVLKLSTEWQAQAMIFLGFEDEKPKEALRQSVKGLITYR